MVKQIIEEKFISIPEVKEILDQLMGRMEKLGTLKPDPFQEATYSYVNTFAKMTAGVARKIIKMLMADYHMELTHAIQIVNIDPQHTQEIKIILEKDANLKNLPEEELKIMIQKIRDLQA